MASFEASLEKLQESVKKLESGELSLEDALQEFEAGVRQVRSCQEYLQGAEKKIELLTQIDASGKPEFQPLHESKTSSKKDEN